MRGEADGLLGMSITAERRKLYDFATPVFTREFGLLVRENENTIHNLEDLPGRRVGVTPGGFPSTMLADDPGIHLVWITNYQIGLQQLVAGEMEAVAGNLWTAAYLAERGDLRGIKVTGKPFAKVDAAVAVKKGNPLAAEIEAALQSLQADGTVEVIRGKWRPREALLVSRGEIRRIVLWSVGAVLLLLIVVLVVWVLTLRRQVRIRHRVEVALRENEERFQLAVRGSTDGLWDWNIITDDVFYADRYRELLGFSAAEFPNRFSSFESILHPDDRERVMRAVRRHLEHRDLYDIEYRLRTQSGEYRWFHARGQAVWDDRGRATRMAGSITDSHHRRQTEAALRRSEELFRAIVEDQNEMIVRWKPDGTRTFVNGAYCRVFGGSREHFIGSSFFPLISEADREFVKARIASLSSTQPVSTAIHRSIGPDGRSLWQEWTDRGIFDAHGQLLELQSTGRDITDRKWAEGLTEIQRQVLEKIATGQPLRATLEALLRLLEAQAEGMRGAIFLLEAESARLTPAAAPSLPAEFVTAVSRAANEADSGLVPRRESIFVADLMNDANWKDWQPIVTAQGFRAYWAVPVFDEERELLGLLAIFHANPGSPNEQHRQLLEIATDTAAVCISKHRTDQALRESEEKFATAFVANPNAALITGQADGRILEVNPQFLKLYRLTRDAVVGRTVMDLGIWRHIADRQALIERVRTEGSVRDYEKEILLPSGETMIMLLSIEPITLHGQPCMLTVALDITERKRAEEALRENQRSMATLLSTLPGVVYRCRNDAKRTMEFISEGCVALTGYAPADFTTAQRILFGELIHPDDEQKNRVVVGVALRERTFFELTYRLRTASGAVKWVWERGLGIYAADGQLLALEGFITDITDRRRAELEREAALHRMQEAREEFTRQLLAAQERERKRLANDLHDGLGQNLSIIKNRLHLAQQVDGVPQEVQAHLEAIERVTAGAIGETRVLARNLRPLHIEQIGVTDSLMGLVQEVSAATDICFERRIEFLDDVLRGEAATHVYRLVQESLNNLVKHSRATTATVTIERDVRFVRVCICDDGVGFNVEPSRGRGGLGLASLAERTRLLGGTMHLDSQPGRGTKLEFQLPIPEEGEPVAGDPSGEVGPVPS